MTKFTYMFLSLAILTAAIGSSAHIPFQSRNTIEGRVTTPDHRPIENVRVFLQNDGYSPIANTITDGSGRFRFMNIPANAYYVEVDPVGTDYERQSQRVEVNPISQRAGSGEMFRVDFVLVLRKSARGKSGGNPTGADVVVFVQEVPEPAKKEYLSGMKSLEKEDFTNAVDFFKRAVEIFPDYYDALDALGSEYVRSRNYQSALPLLTHAVEVNKQGWHGFYSLGIALSESNQRNEGLAALRRALELNQNSVNTNMRLAIILAKDEATHVEAIQLLKKVTQLAGDKVPDAYGHLASLYSKHQQYREAADALEAYLKFAPHASAEQREQYKNLIEQLRQKAKAQKK